MKRLRKLIARWFKRTLLTLAVTVVITMVVGWPAVTTQPGITKNWVAEINALRAEREPEGEAAWPLYRDIIVNDFGLSSAADESPSPLRSDINESYQRQVYPDPLRHADWTSMHFDFHRGILARADAALAKLDRAADRPRFGRDHVNVGDPLSGEQNASARAMGLFIKMPELGELRHLSWLNLFRMRDRASKGDWPGFESASRSGFILGAHVGRAGSLIEELVGVSIAARTLGILQAELVEKRIPAETCRALDRWMRAELRPREWCNNALDMELLSVISSLDTLYGTNGYSGVMLWSYNDETMTFDMRSPWRRPFNAHAVFLATKQDCIDAFTTCFNDARAGLLAPPSEYYAHTLEYNAMIDGLAPLPTMVNILMPAVSRTVRNNIAFERDILATRLMLRLEATHAESGVWPETLDDHPELAELNECPLTGQPFVYALTPDDPYGRAYTLHAPETPWEHMNESLEYTEAREEFVPEPPEDDWSDF